MFGSAVLGKGTLAGVPFPTSSRFVALRYGTIILNRDFSEHVGQDEISGDSGLLPIPELKGHGLGAILVYKFLSNQSGFLSRQKRCSQQWMNCGFVFEFGGLWLIEADTEFYRRNDGRELSAIFHNISQSWIKAADFKGVNWNPVEIHDEDIGPLQLSESPCGDAHRISGFLPQPDREKSEGACKNGGQKPIVSVA